MNYLGLFQFLKRILYVIFLLSLTSCHTLIINKYSGLELEKGPQIAILKCYKPIHLLAIDGDEDDFQRYWQHLEIYFLPGAHFLRIEYGNRHVDNPLESFFPYILDFNAVAGHTYEIIPNVQHYQEGWFWKPEIKDLTADN
jgi:hypothetical protein